MRQQVVPILLSSTLHREDGQGHRSFSTSHPQERSRKISGPDDRAFPLSQKHCSQASGHSEAFSPSVMTEDTTRGSVAGDVAV